MQSAEELYNSAPIKLYQIEDASIAVRIFGSGPPLLFIHGYPLHGYTWRKLLAGLEGKFTCYLIDLPGLGSSEWNDNTDLSFTAQAKRLAKLAELLNINRFSLIAHNTGASIARLLTLAKPEAVQKLIIINTEIPGHRPPWIPLYQTLTVLPGSGAIFSVLLGWQWFLRSPMAMGAFYSHKSLFNNPAYLQPYVKPLIDSSFKMNGAMKYLRGIEWGVVDSFKEKHAQIKCDTLFLWGEDDVTFPIKLGEAMATQFGGKTKFIRLKNTSLMPHEEKPEEILKHLIPFMESTLR